MNLWIRSQDRMSLTMVSDLNINCDNEIIVDDGCSAGKYETKERALEVLDEIGALLKTAELNDDVFVIVYEMPEN